MFVPPAFVIRSSPRFSVLFAFGVTPDLSSLQKPQRGWQMNKPTLWRWIAGRLKENMSALFLAAGMMLIPLGFYLLSEGTIGEWYSRIAVLIGITCLVMAYPLARSEQRKEDSKFITQYRLTKQSSDDLLIELKGLRKESTKLTNPGFNSINLFLQNSSIRSMVSFFSPI